MLTWPLAGVAARCSLVLVALAALVDGPALAAQFAVRQQYVPPSLYGQVFTTAVGLKVGSFALGAALRAGVVATGLGSAEAHRDRGDAADRRRGGRASTLCVFRVFRTETAAARRPSARRA